MIEMMCPICGEIYEAKNRNKRYCSPRCRQAAYRMHSKTYEAFEGVKDAPSPVAAVDVMNALKRAQITANDFSYLSHTAPYQVRGMCERIAVAIVAALDREGFR